MEWIQICVFGSRVHNDHRGAGKVSGQGGHWTDICLIKFGAPDVHSIGPTSICVLGCSGFCRELGIKLEGRKDTVARYFFIEGRPPPWPLAFDATVPFDLKIEKSAFTNLSRPLEDIPSKNQPHFHHNNQKTDCRNN